MFSIALAAALAAGLPSHAEFEERFDLPAETLVLQNLIGEITVEGHGGGNFEVEVTARGRDVSQENLQIETREGSRAELLIQFPLDRETRYVYPKMGSKSETNLSTDSGSEGLSGLLSRIFGLGSSRIRVAGSGPGLEMWADVTIRVPRGKRLEVSHGVGSILAEEVKGDVWLEIHSGRIEARSVAGDLNADVGSGKVVVEDAAGDVTVDTGSGHVELARLQGERVEVDTGSGHIRFDSIQARSVNMDTGSGGVTGRRLSADEAEVDTGSGSVELQFDRIGDGRFNIDTGSGSIRLELPVDASARIHAETGSGGIKVDFEGAQIRRLERHEAEVILGSGAARFVLDTGSGSIRIATAG